MMYIHHIKHPNLPPQIAPYSNTSLSPKSQSVQKNAFSQFSPFENDDYHRIRNFLFRFLFTAIHHAFTTLYWQLIRH
jgi:hypothetical protein